MSKPTVRDFWEGAKLPLTNGESLTIYEILEKDDKWWDGCHDFIQWIFPTVTKSNHCEDAPILTREDAEYLSILHVKLREALINRFLNFLSSVDMTKMNHNHLRVTRFLENEALISDITNNRMHFGDFLILITKLLPIGISLDLIPDFDPKVFDYWYKAYNSRWENVVS
jgi:hypothetical protein